MKKLLVIALGLTCATSTFASNKSIPSQFQGCWVNDEHSMTINTGKIISSGVTPDDSYENIDTVLSVSNTAKNTIKVKVKYKSELLGSGEIYRGTSTDTYKLLNSNTLQNEKGKFRKVKCNK